MATSDDAGDNFERALEFFGLTHAELDAMPPIDAEDIARASKATMLDDGSASARLRLTSEGSLRLSGDGVREHRAELGRVAPLLMNWQRLVTAQGAALVGDKNPRGKVSSKVRKRTVLCLDASLAPGSVIIPIVPASNAVEELHGKGEPLADMGERTLADRAVSGTIELLNHAPGLTHDEIVELLQPSGPRVAGALRDMLRDAASANYNLAAKWRENGQPTCRAAVSAAQAGDIASMITDQHLDEGEETLTGILHTVSDRSNLVLEIDSGVMAGQIVKIKRGNLSDEQIQKIRVGQQVEIMCTVTKISGPAGDLKDSFSAKSLRTTI